MFLIIGVITVPSSPEGCYEADTSSAVSIDES